MSICHGTDYASKYSTRNHTCRHLSDRGMASIYRMGMMHVYRNRLAEKFIGVIIAVVISPGTVHIVSPTAVVMITDTSFPSRNITSAADARGSTFHEAATAGHKVRAVPFLVFGRVGHTIWTAVPVGGMTIVRPIVSATNLITLHTLVIAATSLSLGTGFQTWHKHCHHHR